MAMTKRKVENEANLMAAFNMFDLDKDGQISAEEIHTIFSKSDEDFTIQNGERIAQMVIAKHERAIWNLVQSLSDTSRGAGGFGSTGSQ